MVLEMGLDGVRDGIRVANTCFVLCFLLCNTFLSIPSSLTSFSSSFSSLVFAVLNSHSGRDFSNVNPKFKDELNLDLNQTKLTRNQKMFPLFDDHVNLNLPINNLFINGLGTNFSRNKYSTYRCLFNYNGISYCYVYDNIDLLTSFKNKPEVLQCFQLQKLENTKIINCGGIFQLFVLGKNNTIYFCVVNGKQLLSYKPNIVTEN
jgi:hypothetical protein